MNPIDTKILKIAIIRTSSIGDVVLASTCLTFLRNFLPETRVVWLGRPPSLSLIREAFPNVECIELSKTLKVSEILAQLKDVSFILDLQMNLRSRILSHSFKNRFRRPIFSTPKNQLQRNRLILESRIYGRKRELPTRALEALKPQFVQMRDSLILALQTLKIIPKDFSLSESEHNIAPEFAISHFQNSNFISKFAGNRWIAVSPGASYDTKRAPVEVFSDSLISLKKMLLSKGSFNNLGLIFLGDSSDSIVCEEVNNKIHWPGPVLNLSGTLSLWENAVVLKHSEFLLSNDSALGHIAEAVERPVLVFFGPTVEGFGFIPHRKESRSFSSRLGCRPCSKHGKAPCRFEDKLCFFQISTESVASHMNKLLQNKEALQ